MRSHRTTILHVLRLTASLTAIVLLGGCADLDAQDYLGYHAPAGALEVDQTRFKYGEAAAKDKAVRLLKGFKVDTTDAKAQIDRLGQRGRAVWDVSVPNAHVSIDPYDGSVAALMLGATADVRLVRRPIDADKALPIGAARARKAGLIVPETAPDEVKLTRSGWLYTWNRRHGEYAYRQDFTQLLLSAGDGGLLSFNRSWTSKQPVAPRVAVDGEEAQRTAMTSPLVDVSKYPRPGKPRLMLVNANRAGTLEADLAGETQVRLAWVTLIREGLVVVAEVWVDASTGHLLGGLTFK